MSEVLCRAFPEMGAVEAVKPSEADDAEMKKLLAEAEEASVSSEEKTAPAPAAKKKAAKKPAKKKKVAKKPAKKVAKKVKPKKVIRIFS